MESSVKPCAGEGEAMRRNQQTIIVLLGCMALLWFMWFDLGRKVESGKPFLLNNEWYVAAKVKGEKQ